MPDRRRAIGDTFHAAPRPGRASFTAFHGRTPKTTKPAVLGELARLAPESPRTSLQPDERKPVRINGFRSKGFSAPIERADLDLHHDRKGVEVTPDLRIRVLRPGVTTIKSRARARRPRSR